MLPVMRSIRFPLACLALFAFLPYACADSGDETSSDDDDTGPTSTTSATGGSSSSGGPGPGAGGSVGAGGNNAGGAGGSGVGGAGGMLTCVPGGGTGDSCVPTGHCEICAEGQCMSDWNTCCSTTGCVALSRCVFDKCNADPFALTCIESMCTTEYAAAGGLGGPGSVAGIALGNCLQTQLGTPPNNDCQCCAMQVN